MKRITIADGSEIQCDKLNILAWTRFVELKHLPIEEFEKIGYSLGVAFVYSSTQEGTDFWLKVWHGEIVEIATLDSIQTKDAPKHYNKAIQPIDYIQANELGFEEGNVIKYITRHKDKGGADDIHKAIKYCEYILNRYYND